MEAAVHGYRAHVCSGNYSDRLSKVSTTLEEMAWNYRLSIVEAAEPIENAEDIDIAQVLLLNRFLLSATDLAPSPVSHSRSTVNSAEIAERQQTIDLLVRYRKPAAHVTAHKIAWEILSESAVK